MATRADKFRVGVFLIAGFLLLNAALIWLGASRALEETTTYVTYFAESVQGLEVGSSVKYRGVPLGRVASIRVGPGGELVEVHMNIDPTFRVPKEARTRLAVAGITGSTFVEISPPATGPAYRPPPRLPFPPPERYIPSQPSFLADLTTILNNLGDFVRTLDLPGVAGEVRGLLADSRTLLKSPEFGSAAGRLGQAALAVEKAASRAESLLKDPRVSEALDDAGAASANLRRTAEHLSAETDGLRVSERLDALQGKLGGTADTATDALRRVSEAAQPILVEAGDAVHEAKAAAEGLRRVSERLVAQSEGLRLAERLDAVQGRIGDAAGIASEAIRRAGEGTSAVLGGSALAVRRADALLADLDRGLQQVLDRLIRAVARLESLAASLDRQPSRVLEEPQPEDFR